MTDTSGRYGPSATGQDPSAGSRPAQGYAPAATADPGGQWPSASPYPQTDQQPQQRNGQGYGAPAYGPPPQGGYPGYAPPYGYPSGPRPPRRPGIATGTGVVGIILGVQMFPYAAATLIGAAGLSDNPTEYGRGLLPILWIVGITAIVASVTLFVGAIQLLSGSNVMVVRIGAVLAIVAIWTLTIWAFTQFNEIDSGRAVIITTAALLTILPSVVLGLSLSSTISTWFSKKKAFRAAGLDDN